jgi:hypothetical protein
MAVVSRSESGNNFNKYQTTSFYCGAYGGAPFMEYYTEAIYCVFLYVMAHVNPKNKSFTKI